MAGVFTSEFDLGERVVVVTDSEALIRIVVSIRYLLGGSCIYQLSGGTNVTDHFAEELRRPSAVEATET